MLRLHLMVKAAPLVCVRNGAPVDVVVGQSAATAFSLVAETAEEPLFDESRRPGATTTG
jgi:hypothetical protein